MHGGGFMKRTWSDLVGGSGGWLKLMQAEPVRTMTDVNSIGDPTSSHLYKQEDMIPSTCFHILITLLRHDREVLWITTSLKPEAPLIKRGFWFLSEVDQFNDSMARSPCNRLNRVTTSS